MTTWLNALPSQAGTYALVLASRTMRTVNVGRLGVMSLLPGCYVYVGSAFGPGGLAARIHHHQMIAVRPHWHIDYLRAECNLVEVWFAADHRRREHSWARAFGRLPGARLPLAGFGSSDCACATHLFQFSTKPSFRLFRATIDPSRARLRRSRP